MSTLRTYTKLRLSSFYLLSFPVVKKHTNRRKEFTGKVKRDSLVSSRGVSFGVHRVSFLLQSFTLLDAQPLIVRRVIIRLVIYDLGASRATKHKKKNFSWKYLLSYKNISREGAKHDLSSHLLHICTRLAEDINGYIYTLRGCNKQPIIVTQYCIIQYDLISYKHYLLA